MNRIRRQFAAELERLLPALHETYRCVGVFQKGRTPRNEERLLDQFGSVAPLLAFYRPYVPRRKRAYFDALADTSLDTSDRIVALDMAVGAMHIKFAVERAYMHQESARLREVLEACRVSDTGAHLPANDGGALVTGLGASPGVAVGRAHLTERAEDCRCLPPGTIVVARMTRPELIEGLRPVAGIVTDLGGTLCHAAIIARELGIPCVVGTCWATQRIRPGWMIRLDGSTGSVARVGKRDNEEKSE